MRRSLVPVALLLLAARLAPAQVLRGKVTLADGSPPLQRVIIERVCPGNAPIQEALTGKKGEYFWRVPEDNISVRARRGPRIAMSCTLRARLKDLVSQELDLKDPKILSNLQLPTLVLGRTAAPPSDAVKLPTAAAKAWELAIKAYNAQQWAEMERHARAVTAEAPPFAPAWDALGLACQNRKKEAEARQAFQRAVAADPGALLSRLHLVRSENALQLWPEVAASATGLIQADIFRRYPEAYLQRAVARSMLRENEAALADYRSYLERAPNGPNAALAKAQIEQLTRPAASAPPLAAPVQAEPAAAPVATEAWVPGGRKALAAVAHLHGEPAPESFFLEYCRAIAAETSPLTRQHIPGFRNTLVGYLAAISELVELGERHDDRVVFAFSLKDEKAPRILALLGWKAGADTIEPGDQPQDGPRQQILPVLGIDEPAMQRALETGQTFRLEIPVETATVANAAAWAPLLQAFPTLPGGIAEALIRDPRMARAYAGLGNMPAASAAALLDQAGLRVLVANFAETLWRYGAHLAPQETALQAVWQNLADASPGDPGRFFEALLKTDRGRLAGFYAATAQLDPPRRRFVLNDSQRARHFYAWFREAPDARLALLREFPLENNGAALAGDLDALVGIARLERDRGATLDEEANRILTRNFEAWRALFPYFAALPRLGAPEFRALETFSSAAAISPFRDSIMCEWHSLAALIVLARKNGSLDEQAAAHAFGRISKDLAGRDHSTKAAAILRDLAAAGADLDEAVVTRLLRLDPAARAAFDRVREAQSAPRLSGSKDIGLALSGAVYGAVLDPDSLLVDEDRGLLRKHNFVPEGALFSGAAFDPSSATGGSRFTGGFMNFEEAAHGLTRAAHSPDARPSAPETFGATFRASGRLVEVYATVTDARGNLVDGLRRDQFTILDGGRMARIGAFENGATAVSCALLLDTSLSMEASLPALKSAAVKLIGGLRPNDSVAVYSLSGGFSQLQPFTTDKALATRVVRRAELGELTALYDGLVRVNRDFAGRTGKKVIVVFTDGEDTNSALSAEIAIQRAKSAGVAIYTIAQGHALADSALLKQLNGISQATGGLTFRIPSASEIAPVFHNVLEALLHGYLLAFQPANAEDRGWRRIEVRLRTPGTVRAREGYYPE